MKNYTILSFYSFLKLTDISELQAKLLYLGKRKELKGTILLAKEGFNGSICGENQKAKIFFEELLTLTKADPEAVNLKTNYWHKPAFSRFKIKIKAEIITLGIKGFDITGLTGQYVSPTQWDELIDDPSNTVVIDVRNDYEVEAGTFANAINPKTSTFREFPTWVQNNQHLLKEKNIAMFCTGGVRCEKSTAHLNSLGYKNIFHLKGGILDYLDKTKNKSNRWQGKCFVFDERREVDVELSSSEL